MAGDQGSAKPTLEFLRRPGEGFRARGADAGREAAVFGATDVGRVRTNNEDQFVIATLERALRVEQCGFAENNGVTTVDSPSGRLMMVADGMGGQVHGEVASAVVVDGMLQYAFSMMPWLRNADGQQRELAEGLTNAVKRSQRRMTEVAARKGYRGNMGSTLTLAYVTWPTLYLVHVGDSRAYLLRSRSLHRLTRDHNLAEEMVRQKVISEDEARGSRFASVLTNSVSTSVREVQVELHQVDLRAGDRLLLCTDGLYGELDDDAIAAAMAKVTADEDVQGAVEQLVADARDAGGRDNITAVLARF